MSDFNTATDSRATTQGTHNANRKLDSVRRVSSETKASFKTTELIAYVAAVIAVLIASAVVDKGSDFGAQEAWKYVTFLTIGYMISRGLAKSGSRDFYDTNDNNGR
ncbi:MAG: hypothetical protein JWR90_1439 [Marmoricola sp.]|nr:hypothetical protein [Marmoricola sp.]